LRNHLEIRTTISPTPAFFRRVHFLAASARDVLGSDVPYEIVVSVGGLERRDNLYRAQEWSNHHPLIWRGVNPATFATHGYRATSADRYAHMARADLVMLVDADVIFLRGITDLLEAVEASPAICGIMAHVSPFLSHRERDPHAWWQELAARSGIRDLPLEFEHSGWLAMFEDDSYRHAPAYYNGGMILGTVDLMEQMFEQIPAGEHAVDMVLETYFRPQLARTLAIYRATLPNRVVGMRYNFPNDERFERRYPEEFTDMRILHYLRTDFVDRDRDFSNAETVSRLIARTDLSGSNEILRRRLAELNDVVQDESAGKG
jgi:hypothetical protein